LEGERRGRAEMGSAVSAVGLKVLRWTGHGCLPLEGPRSGRWTLIGAGAADPQSTDGARRPHPTTLGAGMRRGVRV
jgi:hypothetical protein